jgi:hypothetical protein
MVYKKLAEITLCVVVWTGNITNYNVFRTNNCQPQNYIQRKTSNNLIAVYNRLCSCRVPKGCR